MKYYPPEPSRIVIVEITRRLLDYDAIGGPQELVTWVQALMIPVKEGEIHEDTVHEFRTDEL